MTSWTDYQDDISDAISDSMDVDWSASVGAQAVVAWLNEHKPLMADTPRVTVPVEPTEAMLDAWHRAVEAGIFSQTPHPDYMRAAYRAMLSAAPAPEGGAVETAVKIATDLHHAYEQLIYGLPKYLEAENLTDEENMIREAWITLDVTAHRLAALATREEAPAEAGERIVGTIAHVSNGRSELPELIASALRAQPPAREDAQPYGWIYERFDVGSGWCAPNEWHPAQFTRTPPKPETSRNVITLYTHPAPDRVAVEALEAINHIRSEMVGVPVDSEAANAWAMALDAAADHARQALAALQAEQKGGA